MHEVKLKVKLSHYRHGQSLRAEVEALRIFRWRMKVVRFKPYALATFTPQEIFLVPISVRGGDDPRAIVQLDGLS